MALSTSTLFYNLYHHPAPELSHLPKPRLSRPKRPHRARCRPARGRPHPGRVGKATGTPWVEAAMEAARGRGGGTVTTDLQQTGISRWPEAQRVFTLPEALGWPAAALSSASPCEAGRGLSTQLPPPPSPQGHRKSCQRLRGLSCGSSDTSSQPCLPGRNCPALGGTAGGRARSEAPPASSIVFVKGPISC